MYKSFNDCHDNNTIDIGSASINGLEYLNINANQEETDDDEELSVCIHLKKQDAIEFANTIYKMYGLGKKIVNK